MARDREGSAGGSPEDDRPGDEPSMSHVPAPMPRSGDTFAERYSILKQVGRGGMGEVFQAIQAPLDRQVALKILRPPRVIEDDPQYDARFLREAAAASKLEHPNTITIFDFGQTAEGQLYIVMEFLEGLDLKTTLARDGIFSAERAVHIAAQVCKSLSEAHNKGIIHRDLKPANVLVVDRDSDPNFVKVVDFGLVKFRGEDVELTLAGKFVGSPKYTSPDALRREVEVDHRADIYSLGVLLYVMLTGAPPFDGDSMQVLAAHLNEQPKPMSVTNPEAMTSPELEALVARCLEKDPARRYQSMDEMLVALREIQKILAADGSLSLSLDKSLSRSIVVPAGVPEPRGGKLPGAAHRRKKARRRSQLLVSCFLGLLAVVAFLLWSLIRSDAGRQAGPELPAPGAITAEEAEGDELPASAVPSPSKDQAVETPADLPVLKEESSASSAPQQGEAKPVVPAAASERVQRSKKPAVGKAAAPTPTAEDPKEEKPPQESAVGSDSPEYKDNPY